MKLRGVSEESLSSPKSLKFLFKGRWDRFRNLFLILKVAWERERRAYLRLFTCDFLSRNVSLDVIKIDVQLGIKIKASHPRGEKENKGKMILST